MQPERLAFQAYLSKKKRYGEINKTDQVLLYISCKGVLYKLRQVAWKVDYLWTARNESGLYLSINITYFMYHPLV